LFTNLLPLSFVPFSFVCAGQARPIFPFTAVIGQEEMKLALILNVIDPKIGGVMIMGDRGTGKTTTIRALADLLPQVPVVAKDPFNSGAHVLAHDMCAGLDSVPLMLRRL
jgi:Mg-chelatase subunit ChlI